MPEADVKAFLEECTQSGDQAYGALKDVLARLHNVETRPQARSFLTSVQKYVGEELGREECLSTFHFYIHQLSLSDYHGFQEKRQSLTLLELPSIFIPEDWSFTFFEGINRHPDSGFRDRDIAELGCGNGWISIALAEKWSPRKVYGLDINPRAIKAAWINLYLNALNEDGSPILDHEGRTLLDRVEFYESDLLSYCRDHNILLDRIVGCIPQILNPDPEAMHKIVSENASEDFLYSLSNYCALQGFVEDQFGLGLIARAVEEGIAVMKPSGAMIFNIGGRPGQAVCERLFERRGFHISKLWQTRVIQAADTDILALVEIEKNSRHRFEFFMGRVSEEPVSARTAWAYAESGGEISHGLSVYSCQLRQPNQVKTIFKFLNNGFQETRGALDLSFKDESVAEEKIPFLAHLACVLEENSHIPQELPAGSTRFRNLIAGFMRLYHNIPIGPNNIVVFPSRSVAIEEFLRLYSPELALVDTSIIKLLPKQWLLATPVKDSINRVNKMPDLHSVAENGGSFSNNDIVVIEAPNRVDLVMQLLKHLKPQIVVTSLADFEMRSSTAFEQLLDACAKVGSRVMLDISDHMELSSLPGTNGVLQYLAAHTLPLHATIVCGLVKNKVYSDLEVAFIISENQNLLHAMTNIGEMISGRTAVSSQFYYGCLFHELLTFQLPNRHTTEQRLPREEKETNLIEIGETVRCSIKEAELSCAGPHIPEIVHMDYDENSLPVPSVVKMAIFESFARQNITDIEMDPTFEILEFVNVKLGVSAKFCSGLFLSESSTSLFTKLVLACVENNGTLLFPTGSNGTYFSAAKCLRANVMIIPTKAEDNFKLTEKGIDECLRWIKNPWVYISGPTINPTGLVYSNDEICSIMSACKRHGARVIVDTCFSGLEFYSPTPILWNLHDIVSKNLETSSFAVAIIGSSFEMLTGGLECSFAVVQDPILINAFKDASGISRPHCTLRYTIKKLLGLWIKKPNILREGLVQQQNTLQQRAEQLFQVLKDCGWEPIKPLGGVSMIARPTAYEGKTISYRDQEGNFKEIKLDSKNIREVILQNTGLCVSSSSWTCIPHYCRFVIALKEEDFIKALQALKNFRDSALGGK